MPVAFYILGPKESVWEREVCFDGEGLKCNIQIIGKVPEVVFEYFEFLMDKMWIL